MIIRVSYDPYSSTARFNFKIGATMIGMGLRWHAERCPIAFDLNESGYSMVAVTRRYIIFQDEVFEYRMPKLPKPLSDWIRAYDHGKHVKPLSIYVEANVRSKSDGEYTPTT